MTVEETGSHPEGRSYMKNETTMVSPEGLELPLKFGDRDGLRSIMARLDQLWRYEYGDLNPRRIKKVTGKGTIEYE